MLNKNPEFKAKVTKELADTLSKGWETATQKYPILSTLEPRYIVKNERGRSLQAKHILKEVEKEQYIKMLDNLQPEKLPESISESDFLQKKQILNTENFVAHLKKS